MAAAIVVLVGLGAFCGWRYYSDVYVPNRQITDAEREQRELFQTLKPDLAPSTPATPAAQEPSGTASAQAADGISGGSTVNWVQTLTEKNGGSVGWITIDGTVIDYPVVQASDNAYYLDHGFDGDYNYGLGCPFLDYRCKGDFSDFNSIIYAHHIQGYQALFSDITLYKDSSFMEQHPAGTLLTGNGARKVRFFAYMLIPNPSFAYSTGIAKKSERDGYIDGIFEEAVYTTGYTAEELKKKDDLHLLLLSTCAYEFWNARGVLAGVIE